MSRDRTADLRSPARQYTPRNSSNQSRERSYDNGGRRNLRSRNGDQDEDYGNDGGDGYRGERYSRHPARPSSPQLRQPHVAASRRMNNDGGRSFEMSSRRPGNYKSAYSGSSRSFKIPPQPDSTVESMDVFFAEISTINDLLKRLKGNVENIVLLQGRIVSMEGYGDGEEQLQMDQLAAECKLIMESVKKRAKAIELENARLPPSHPSLGMRTTQHGQIKQKFLDFLRTYNEAEREFSRQVKEQMERSIQSMNPDFTEEEIKEALDEQMEGDYQSMMMDQSGRYEGASSALAEAQSRQNEMQKIEETIVQLTEMFIEMSTLVEAQNEVITTIEQHVETTEQYTEQANVELDTAIVTAKKVRGRKWQLLCCCFLLLVVGGVLLYFFVIKDLIDGRNANSSTSTRPRTTTRTGFVDTTAARVA